MPNHSAATPSEHGGRLLGTGIFLCALLLLAILDAIAKDLVQRHPAPFVNVVRYMIVLGMAIVLMLRKGIPMTPNPPQRTLLLCRGVMLGIVGNTFMPALKLMPLAEATAIYFVSPLIIVALSPWLLGERVGIRQWAAVGAGFGGMLLIVRPGGNLSMVGTMLMVMAALSFAMVQILTRKLAGRVSMEQQFFYTAAICTAMSAIPALFYLPQHLPSSADMVLLSLIGLLSGLGQYLLIAAIQRVPASALAPFNYFHLLLAVIFSIVIFGQHPGVVALLGMLIIACAGLSLMLPALGASGMRAAIRNGLGKRHAAGRRNRSGVPPIEAGQEQ